MDLLNYAFSILISLAIGLAAFISAFKFFNWMVPGMDLSHQLKSGNVAVAIFLAGLFIGLGILLGGAIQ